jgi:hypothetical protein
VMTEIDAFFAEIRSWPRFVDAASADPAWLNVVSKLEGDIDEVLRRAGEDPAWLDCYDDILAIVRKRDISVKERLLGIIGPLATIRDNGRTVN